MEMATSTLPFAAVPAASAASGNSANGAMKSTGNALFSKVLSSQVNTPAASAATDTSQPVGIVEQIINSTVTAGASNELQISAEELLKQLEQLLDKLDEAIAAEEEAAVSEDELAAMLQHSYAIMALLGVQVQATQVQQPQEANDLAALGAEKVSNKAATIIQLQDALLNLQSALQHGEIKAGKLQDPFPLLAQFVQKLDELLANKSVTEAKLPTEAADNKLPDWAVAKSNGSDADKHLEKLHQQSNRVSLTAEQQAVSSSANQAVAVNSGAEENAAVPVNQLMHARTVPVSAPSNQAATTFVFADKFADTMSGMIVQKFSIATFNGISEAKLKLYPEQLGQVDVRITMQNGQLTAVFQTDTSMAKELIENQMAQLRAALQAQGLNVDKLNVTHEQAATLEFDQQQEKQSGGRFTNQEDQSDNSHGEASFETELIEQVVIQQLGFGRAVNETV